MKKIHIHSQYKHQSHIMTASTRYQRLPVQRHSIQLVNLAEVPSRRDIVDTGCKTVIQCTVVHSCKLPFVPVNINSNQKICLGVVEIQNQLSEACIWTRRQAYVTLHACCARPWL